MVEVQVNHGSQTVAMRHEQATSYDVTEDGALVVYCDEKPFVVYNPHHWVSAAMNPEDI